MRILLATAVLLLSVLPATGSPPPSCAETRTPVEIVTGEAGVYYVDVLPVEVRALWIYAESNGIWTPKGPGVYTGPEVEADLQRGGGSEILPDDAKACFDEDALSPDHLVL